MTEQLGKCSKGWLLKNYFGVRRDNALGVAT